MTALRRLAKAFPSDELLLMTWSSQAHKCLRSPGHEDTSLAQWPAPWLAEGARSLPVMQEVPPSANRQELTSANKDNQQEPRAPARGELPSGAAAKALGNTGESASSSDSASSNEESEPRFDPAWDTVQWVAPRSGNLLHRAHPDKLSVEGWSRPLCRTVRSLPDTGVGARSAVAAYPSRSWCESCAADLWLEFNST